MSDLPRNLLVEKKIPAETAAPGVPALVTRSSELMLRGSALPRRADEPRARMRRLLLVGASLLALSGAGYFGWEYWTVGRFHIRSTTAGLSGDVKTGGDLPPGSPRAVPETARAASRMYSSVNQPWQHDCNNALRFLDVDVIAGH